MYHRGAFREEASKPSRLLALNGAIAEKPQAAIHSICGDRVTHRGRQPLSCVRTPDAKSHEEAI